MSKKRTYRPRITRDNRDRVIEAAEDLNGAEPDNFHHALGLVTDYLHILYGNPDCPHCGEWDTERYSIGTYRCWRCEEDQEHGYFDVWDVLNPENEERSCVAHC